jgi:ATP-binding cassette subfamily B protein
MKKIWQILIFAKSLWPYYLAITIFSILVAILSQAPPLLTKVITDTVVTLSQHGHTTEKPIILAVIGIFASGILVTLISDYSGYLGDIMAAKLQKILSERYFEHLLKLPQSYFDNEMTGTIINRLNRSIDQITNFLNVFANNFFSTWLTLILTLVIVAYYSWQVAVLLFAVYPLFLLLTMRTSKRWVKFQAVKNEHSDIASGRFAEVVSQIKVVKSFIREKHERSFFSKHYGVVVDETYRQSSMWHWQDVYRRAVLEMLFFGVFLFVGIGTYNGHFTLGEMFMLMQYTVIVRTPIFGMSFIVDNTQRAIAGSEDYFAVMSIDPAITDREGAKRLRKPKGDVVFDHVTFGYNKNKLVLKDIDFTVKAGAKLALVGESGEGKTTITNLLLRLYEPNQGTISIGGDDILTVTQSSLRKKIGIVFQDPALFSGTIRENIVYGKPKASQQQIEAVAKAANAHDFIQKLEQGYDTEIGERGIKLSGGQKQRIAIARALLKDAPILILDEATSSLDSYSEQLVQEALERLMKDRTTIIIAHRLSTIAHVDKIVTIKGGRVDEIGSPKELAQSGGIYAQLLRLQGSSLEKQKRELKKFDIAVEEH